VSSFINIYRSENSQYSRVIYLICPSQTQDNAMERSVSFILDAAVKPMLLFPRLCFCCNPYRLQELGEVLICMYD
jgi:hypothetical protein